MIVSAIDLLNETMVVDYIRVRKSNIKELQEMIEERRNKKIMLFTMLAIPSLVVAVALIGLFTVL